MNEPGDRLPLLSAGPSITFLAKEFGASPPFQLDGILLGDMAHVCEQLAQSHIYPVAEWTGIELATSRPLV